MTTTEFPCCISGVCDRHNLRNQIVMAVEEYRELVASPDAFAGDVARCLADIARYANEALDIEVPLMRRAGSSWTAVGQALDVSRQAAQQRFGGGSAMHRDLDALLNG